MVTTPPLLSPRSALGKVQAQAVQLSPAQIRRLQLAKFFFLIAGSRRTLHSWNLNALQAAKNSADFFATANFLRRLVKTRPLKRF